MRRRSIQAWGASLPGVCALAWVLGQGCSVFEPPSDEAVSCAEKCHGERTNAAPPKALNGKTSTTEPGVGAHRAHLLRASKTHRSGECADCHVVPTSKEVASHIDNAPPAEVSFGALARTDGAEPQYDGARCTNVYCHGGTLPMGGTNTSPQWTKVDGTEAECGTCHSMPPALPHVPADQCSGCHSIIDADRNFIEPERHGDGIVDTTYDPVCGDCHGKKSNASPPPDTQGHIETKYPGVGAHQSHMKTSDWRATIKCSECHIVPESVYDPGHFDSARPAEITWGPTAHAHGAKPSYDGTKCSGVYCHGGSSSSQGGALTEPIWTKVDGTQAKCGTCHGRPPPLPHPPRSDCHLCHPTVDSSGKITNPERHVDGVLDMDVSQLDCTSCHGSYGEAAPPQDTQGNSSTEAPGVGAHRAHLGQSTWHLQIQCAECHMVPSTVMAKGHFDSDLPAEVTFGKLSSSKGTAPSYNGVTCTGVYCHGASMKGGKATEPIWTKLDGTQIKCGACHGMPPPAPHPAQAACWNCHTMAGAGPNGPIIIDPARHIDGIIQTL